MPPIKAAIVVIMIGLKRVRQASYMASSAGFTVCLFCVYGKVDHHDGVLFDDAYKHNQSEKAIYIQVNVSQHKNEQRAQSC